MENNEMERALLQQIANTVSINYQYMEQPGLLNGYMGIVIFLYHYSRYSQFDNYSVLADELVNLIYTKLNKGTALGFANGLAGIGWGFKYLKNNHFLEMDDDVLEEIDKAICRRTQDDFLKELEDEVSLYSEGLYFMEQDLDAEKREMIYTHLVDLQLQIKDKALPISYINSILYTLYNLQKAGCEINKLEILLNPFSGAICHSLNTMSCEISDIAVLRYFVNQFDCFILEKNAVSDLYDKVKNLNNTNVNEYINWSILFFKSNLKLDLAKLKVEQLGQDILGGFSNLDVKLSLPNLSAIGLNLMF